jgi:hypothetical protein
MQGQMVVHAGSTALARFAPIGPAHRTMTDCSLIGVLPWCGLVSPLVGCGEDFIALAIAALGGARFG